MICTKTRSLPGGIVSQRVEEYLEKRNNWREQPSRYGCLSASSRLVWSRHVIAVADLPIQFTCLGRNMAFTARIAARSVRLHEKTSPHGRPVAAFRKSQESILAGVLPDQPKYREVCEIREQAYGAMLKSRRIYWEHLQEHGCRAHGTPAADVN